MKDDEYLDMWKSLSGAAKDTLRALVINGPLWDGDVPSKSGRDELLDLRLASKAVVKREQGYQVATYKGWNVYKAGRPHEFEPADDVAKRAIDVARKVPR